MSNVNIQLLSIVSLVALVACGGGQEDAQRGDNGEGDTFTENVSELADAPTVLSTVPADGARGVFVNDAIEIHFGQQMDPATVEIKSGDGQFPELEWNDGLDVLTIEAELDYADGWGTHPELFEARVYSFTLNAGAADLDGEVVGEPVTWTFQTAIRMEVDVLPDLSLTRTIMGNGGIHNEGGDLYIGDSAIVVDESLRALLTFDISSLPEGSIGHDATLVAEQVHIIGLPYVYLGTIYAEQVQFDEIGLDTWDTPPSSAPYVVSGSPDLDLKAGDVTDIFSDSLSRRDEVGDRVQLMLGFAEDAVVNGQGDNAKFELDTVALELHYLAE